MMIVRQLLTPRRFEIQCMAGFLALCALPVPWANAGPKEDFAKLETEMDAAQDEFAKALDAFERKTPPAAQGPTPPPKFPNDPRVAVLRKMEALMTASAITPDGATVAHGVFHWALVVEPQTALPRFEILARQFPEEPALAEILASVPEFYRQSGTPDGWIQALEQFRKVTKKTETHCAASFTLGRIHLDLKKLTDARESFNQARVAHDPELAKAAKGFLFEIDHLQVGMPAPDFTTKTLDGKEVSLRSLRGKVVLLNFWATWCPPCVGEIPHLQSAVAKLAGKPFEIVSVSVDDEREALQNLLSVRKAPGLQTWDEKGGENPVAELYNVYHLPTWYLIDAQGVIRERDPDPEKLVPTIEATLAPRP